MAFGVQTAHEGELLLQKGNLFKVDTVRLIATSHCFGEITAHANFTDFILVARYTFCMDSSK